MTRRRCITLQWLSDVHVNVSHGVLHSYSPVYSSRNMFCSDSNYTWQWSYLSGGARWRVTRNNKQTKKDSSPRVLKTNICRETRGDTHPASPGLLLYVYNRHFVCLSPRQTRNEILTLLKRGEKLEEYLILIVGLQTSGDIRMTKKLEGSVPKLNNLKVNKDLCTIIKEQQQFPAKG